MAVVPCCGWTSGHTDRHTRHNPATGSSHTHLRSVAVTPRGRSAEGTSADVRGAGALDQNELAILFTLCEQAHAVVVGSPPPGEAVAEKLAAAVIATATVKSGQEQPAADCEMFCNWALHTKTVGHYLLRIRKGHGRAQSTPAASPLPWPNNNV